MLGTFVKEWFRYELYLFHVGGSLIESLIERGLCYEFFFFFQAEDGIRDRTVTGVQTCALPISDEDMGRQAIAAMKGISLEDLKQKGWIPLGITDAPFANGGFPTPSGKCEFYSDQIGRASCRERV